MQYFPQRGKYCQSLQLFGCQQLFFFRAMGSTDGAVPKGHVFNGLQGLGDLWDQDRGIRDRARDVGAVVVDKPPVNQQECKPEAIVNRTIENARYNSNVMLPLFAVMNGKPDKIPSLEALQAQLKFVLGRAGRGNPSKSFLQDQAWSCRYLFGVVKDLVHKPQPPRDLWMDFIFQILFFTMVSLFADFGGLVLAPL